MATTTVVGLDPQQWTESEARQLVGTAEVYSETGTAIHLNAAGDVLHIGESAAPNGGQVSRWDLVGSTWVEDVGARRVAPDTNFQKFGMGMAVSGDGLVMAVGAPWYDLGTYDGRVSIYDWSGTVWNLRGHINAEAGTVYDDNGRFGAGIWLNNDGSELHAGNYQTDHGVLYIYDWNDPNWDLRPAAELVIDTNVSLQPTSIPGIYCDGFQNRTYSPDGTKFWCVGSVDSGTYTEHIFEFHLVDDAWELANLSPFPSSEMYSYYGYLEINDACTKIAIGLQVYEDSRYTSNGIHIFLATWDGDRWAIDEESGFPIVGGDENRSTKCIVWTDDDEILVVNPVFYTGGSAGGVVAELVSLEHSDAPSATANPTITGPISRTSLSGNELAPVYPPLQADSLGGLVDTGFYEDAIGLSMSHDGLRMIAPNFLYGICAVLSRNSRDEKFTHEQYINLYLETDPFWIGGSTEPWVENSDVPYYVGPFGEFGGDTALSGDGNVVVTCLQDLAANSSNILPTSYNYPLSRQFIGSGNWGGVATWIRNPDTNEWIYQTWYQDPNLLGVNGTIQGYALGLSFDGSILWMGSWGGGTTVFSRYQWDAALGNWEPTGSALTTSGGSDPSWGDWKESWHGTASPSGDVFTCVVYESEVGTTGPAMRVKWNGAAIVREGPVFWPFEYGIYAHFLGITCGGSEDKLYGYVAHGSEDIGWAVKYEWSGSTHVFVKELVEPFVNYSYSYDFMGIDVTPDEQTVITVQFCADAFDTPELNNQFWQRTHYDEDNYICVYEPPSEDFSCYTKVADGEQLEQTGSICVIEWVPPPPLPSDQDNNLPSPPLFGSDNNSDITCTQLNDTTRVYSGFSQDLAVNANPEYALKLAEDLYNLDFTNGPCDD